IPVLSFEITFFFSSFKTGKCVLHCSATSSILSSQTMPNFLRFESSLYSWSNFSFDQFWKSFFGIRYFNTCSFYQKFSLFALFCKKLAEGRGFEPLRDFSQP